MPINAEPTILSRPPRAKIAPPRRLRGSPLCVTVREGQFCTPDEAALVVACDGSGLRGRRCSCKRCGAPRRRCGCQAAPARTTRRLGVDDGRRLSSRSDRVRPQRNLMIPPWRPPDQRARRAALRVPVGPRSVRVLTALAARGTPTAAVGGRRGKRDTDETRQTVCGRHQRIDDPAVSLVRSCRCCSPPSGSCREAEVDAATSRPPSSMDLRKKPIWTLSANDLRSDYRYATSPRGRNPRVRQDDGGRDEETGSRHPFANHRTTCGRPAVKGSSAPPRESRHARTADRAPVSGHAKRG